MELRFGALFVVTALFCLPFMPALAASEYEMLVRDAKGNVVLENPDEGDIPRLVGFLVDGGEVEAGYAREILVGFGPKAVPELLKALNFGNKNYNRVLYVLNNVKDERAVAPISKRLTDPDREVAGSARGALISHGDIAVPVLAGLIKDAEYHDVVLDALTYIEPSTASLKLVRAMVQSENALERAGAGYVLGDWKDRESEPAILRLLADPEQIVREGAVKGYAKLYTALPMNYDKDILLGLLDDPSAKVREGAVGIIRKIPGDKPVARLIALLKGEQDPAVISITATTLAEAGDNTAVLPLLDKMLAAGDRYGVVHLVYALGELKAVEAVPYIINLFKTGKEVHYSVQKESFMSLEKIGEPVDLAIFLPYLVNGDPHHTGSPELLDLLDAMAKPGDKEVIAAIEKFRQGEGDTKMGRKADSILEKLR